VLQAVITAACGGFAWFIVVPQFGSDRGHSGSAGIVVKL
jgi:hypothetical protein